MDFKCAVVVLSILVASVAGVCDKTKGQTCMTTLNGAISPDKTDCGPVEAYKACVVPISDTCDKIVQQSYQQTANVYKNEPYNCQVVLWPTPGNGVTASCGANIMACSEAMMPETNCSISGVTASCDANKLMACSEAMMPDSNCCISEVTASCGANIMACSEAMMPETNCSISGFTASCDANKLMACSEAMMPETNCCISGVTASCDANKLMECTKAMMPVVKKISQEASAEGGQDINKIKELMCGAGREMAKCLTVAIKGCGKDMERQALTALQMFNKEPFQCNIDVGSTPSPPSGNGAGGDGKDGQKCDASGIGECAQIMGEEMPKVLQEAAAGGDEDKMIEAMCGVGKTFKDCLLPLIPGCGPDMKDNMIKAFEQFNKEPFECGLDLSSAPRITVASLLTVVLALLISSLFN